MAGDVHIRGISNGTGATVSPYGEVVVSPYSYSTPSFKNLDTTNTAYTFWKAKQDKFFVITAIFLQANKNVSASTAATVDIYEAAQETDTTIAKSIFQLEMVRNDRILLAPLNIQVTVGRFVNGKTTDDDVLATVSGYYVANGVV